MYMEKWWLSGLGKGMRRKHRIGQMKGERGPQHDGLGINIPRNMFPHTARSRAYVVKFVCICFVLCTWSIVPSCVSSVDQHCVYSVRFFCRWTFCVVVLSVLIYQCPLVQHNTQFVVVLDACTALPILAILEVWRTKIVRLILYFSHLYFDFSGNHWTPWCPGVVYSLFFPLPSHRMCVVKLVYVCLLLGIFMSSRVSWYALCTCGIGLRCCLPQNSMCSYYTAINCCMPTCCTVRSSHLKRLWSLWHSGAIQIRLLLLFMVALWNRETIYIFMLWFVLSSSSSSFFSSPNLSRRRFYVCHTSTHGVALVRI